MPEIASLIQALPESIRIVVLICMFFLCYQHGPKTARWLSQKALGRPNHNDGNRNTRLAVEELRNEIKPLLEEIRDELREGNKNMRDEFSKTRTILRDHNETIHGHVTAITDAIHQTQLMITENK